MPHNVPHITTFLGTHRYIILLLLLTVVLCMTFTTFAATDRTVIYYYCAESTINNFKSLKMEFDRYLSARGSYEFQPFSNREAFENHIKDKMQCILLLSSWHYRSIYNDYSLVAVLVGMRNGQKYQKRVLVGKDEITKGGQIASASSLQHTSNCLRGMLKEKEVIDKATILTVPKDIDALLSVGFGISQMALTTRSALNELGLANPSLYQKMKILAEGEESLLLIVAVPERFMKEAKAIVTTIQNMATDPDGKEKLRMLGLDGWQTLDQSDRLKLEAR